MSRKTSRIDSILDCGEALLRGDAEPCPIVITTRIRLARNLAGQPFPGWAKEGQRRDILDRCMAAMGLVDELHGAVSLPMDGLSALEKQILAESHLISRELMGAKSFAGLVAQPSDGCSIMINEEDHLRIQMMQAGMALEPLWERVNALDDAIEGRLDYAFSPRLGYLTSCPTNLGTAIRASAMMHLPGLVLKGHIEQVIRMVNQLGIAVRGHFGEGSEASGSIFQISNQQTLGEDEMSIIRRLHNVLDAVIEQERNARLWLVEEKGETLYDKIGRARGMLQNAYVLSSGEAMEHLSMIRLGVDLGMFAEQWRVATDRLMIECQPGHMQRRAEAELEPARRDVLRAALLRESFSELPALTRIETSAQ